MGTTERKTVEMDVRPLNREEHAAAVVALGDTTWASEQALTVEESAALKPWRSILGAFVEHEGAERLAGMWGSYALAVTVPGPRGSMRPIPVEGATIASVHPDLRRRGVMSALIAAHLERCREVGSAITVHHASETGIYGRFGYAPASWSSAVTLGSGTRFTLAPELREMVRQTNLSTEPATAAHAERIGELQRHASGTHLGGLQGETWHLARLVKDFPQLRGSKHPFEVLWATRDGEDVGFAIFQRESRWNDDLPDGSVSVPLMEADDVGALVAMVEHLCDYDLMRTFRFPRWGFESALAMLGQGPRALGLPRLNDGLWLRIVDLPRAVNQRGYGPPSEVVVAVTDARLPENAGTWQFRSDLDGVGTMTRTDRDPDVSLDIADLGAAYLGQRPLSALARAGFIQEHRAGALDALSVSWNSCQVAFGGFSF